MLLVLKSNHLDGQGFRNLLKQTIDLSKNSLKKNLISLNISLFLKVIAPPKFLCNFFFHEKDPRILTSFFGK